MTQNQRSATGQPYLTDAEANRLALFYGVPPSPMHAAGRNPTTDAEIVLLLSIRADLQWQLNEALSALHEAHVDQHHDAEGNPVDCELCHIWRDGVKTLNGNRRDVAEA